MWKGSLLEKAEGLYIHLNYYWIEHNSDNKNMRIK